MGEWLNVTRSRLRRYSRMRLPILFRHAVFLWGCRAILVLAVGFLIWAAMIAHWQDALVWGAIGAVTAVVLYARDTLPPFHGFLLALAAGVNGAGYALTLWHTETFFDEAVHGFTSFAGMAAIGWWLCRRHGVQLSCPVLFGIIVAVGLGLGLLWEGFELLIGIIGSPRDTLIDLGMNGVGAAVAAALTCCLRPAARGN